MDLTVQSEADALVEQQRHLCEDLQADLAQANEWSQAPEE